MLDFRANLMQAKGKKRQREETPQPQKTEKTKKRRKCGRVERFQGGVFRWLNEQLYTQNSQHSWDMFTSNPAYFAQYHQGFQLQQAAWPVKPLDWVKKQITLRDTGTAMTIADLGCGEGELALHFDSLPHLTFLSFDLCPSAPHVSVADIAHLPLPSASVDLVVYCLSLMGTNHVDCLTEGRRVLRKKGEMLIAEVESRISDLVQLKQGLKALGLRVVSDTQQGYFHSFTLRKGKAKGEVPSLLFHPCKYKPR